MISFIVIGKNEGWRLSLCIQSIVNVVASDNIKEYEIIYVDSNSTDDSISRVQKFEDVKIFKITGECNAAIGRNIGALESQGDVLFFVDGDMELLAGAISCFLNEKMELLYPFCTGLFDDYFHNEHWQFIEKKAGNYINITTAQESYHPVTGGLFLITKKLWNEVNGMDTRFVRSQDIDLALRLSQKNILLLKKPVLIVNHYTISYSDKSRVTAFQGMNASYYRGLLLRRNLFNKYYHGYALRNDYTGFSLFFFLLLSILNPFFILFYLFLLLLRVTAIKFNKLNSTGFFYLLKVYFLRDMNLFISSLFFYPKKKELNYIRIE